MLIDVGGRESPAAEAKLARTSVNDDVDRIQTFSALQGSRDLFRSGHRAAEQHRNHTRPQACEQHRNVRDCGIDEDDFPGERHVMGSDVFLILADVEWFRALSGHCLAYRISDWKK